MVLYMFWINFQKGKHTPGGLLYVNVLILSDIKMHWYISGAMLSGARDSILSAFKLIYRTIAPASSHCQTINDCSCNRRTKRSWQVVVLLALSTNYSTHHLSDLIREGQLVLFLSIMNHNFILEAAVRRQRYFRHIHLNKGFSIQCHQK